MKWLKNKYGDLVSGCGCALLRMDGKRVVRVDFFVGDLFMEVDDADAWGRTTLGAKRFAEHRLTLAKRALENF